MCRDSADSGRPESRKPGGRRTFGRKQLESVARAVRIERGESKAARMAERHLGAQHTKVRTERNAGK